MEAYSLLYLLSIFLLQRKRRKKENFFKLGLKLKKINGFGFPSPPPSLSLCFSVKQTKAIFRILVQKVWLEACGGNVVESQISSAEADDL